jgi:molybdenum cofactor synthesis domain-containing protein
MPKGADAVVMVEDTVAEGEARDVVLIGRSVSPGDGIRQQASDVRPGDVVIERGCTLGPNHLGVLASLGERTVTAYPKLRVGVISSGDELVANGAPLAPGQIRDANTELLMALLHRANATPVDLGIVRDDEDALTAAFVEGARTCDALVTSGGVSMGDFDLVKVILDRLGDMQWMQIAIRPAKPFAFGLIDGATARVPVFGLPGNPVSSLVSFELFARPGLRAMMGDPNPFRPSVAAIAGETIRRGRPDEKIHFVRVRAELGGDGRLHLYATGEQGSHQLAHSAKANALLALRDGEEARAGSETRVTLIA